MKPFARLSRVVLSALVALLLLSVVACGGSETPAASVAGEVELPAATAAPVEPTAAPPEPTTALPEPTAAPADPTAAPAEPTAAPAEPTTAPAEPTGALAAPVAEALPPAAGATPVVGNAIEVGDLTLVVLGWRVSPGSEFNQPSEGNQFVIVDTLLVNRGQEPASLSTLFQMTLNDSAGQSYDLDISAMIDAAVGSPDGELSPGERLRGAVGFQTPAGASGLQFAFDGTLFGGQPVIVDLGSEPVAYAPPGMLAGEVAPAVVAVGEPAEVNNLRLTVNGVSFPPGQQFAMPNEGNQFVVVDLSLENIGATPQSISSVLQMKLKDDTGQIYGADLMGPVISGIESPDGEIAPGETWTRPVTFQTPLDAAGLTFVFDGDLISGAKLFFALPAP